MFRCCLRPPDPFSNTHTHVWSTNCVYSFCTHVSLTACVCICLVRMLHVRHCSILTLRRCSASLKAAIIWHKTYQNIYGLCFVCAVVCVEWAGLSLGWYSGVYCISSFCSKQYRRCCRCVGFYWYISHTQAGNRRCKQTISLRAGPKWKWEKRWKRD